MTAALRRTLVRRWLRALVGIAALLALPVIFPRLMRAVDPQQEREKMAQAAERRQRASGEVFVTPSGQTRRAMVYTPARPPESSAALPTRALVWWSRLLAASVALGLVTGTWRAVRDERASETATRL